MKPFNRVRCPRCESTNTRSHGGRYDKRRGVRESMNLFAKTLLLASEMISATEVTSDWLQAHPRLHNALTTARDCTKHIEPEQHRIKTLLQSAKSQEEREAREFQLDYVERYLLRASELATERLEYFSLITSQEAIDAENDKCSRDQVHWFHFYAWGYDPRARTALSTVPFELYPTQQALVEWLDDIVFHRRTSGLIEKARDEGATETIVRWGIHKWRYREGFSMLLSSRTEDEVDTKKKQGTLFERARFQIRLLPQWMRPEKFDVEKDMLADKLIASPNGNALVGQAPVENMGRGDRVTCAMFDEFAFWRFGGYPQMRSMSQTTDSIIMPSSVAGRFNQYAESAWDGVTEKFVMDWRENPFKDVRWYNSLPYGYISPKMSSTTIAQEVDRNYDASQPGKVWKYDETLVFITQSEFLQPFKEAGLEHKFFNGGKFRIPDDWTPTRTTDYGQSDGHEWGYVVGAQPKATYPLADTHFIFIAQWLEPTGLTTDQAVHQWRLLDESVGLRDASGRWIAGPHVDWCSHEQAELRRVLMHTYGETWHAWDTDYQTGIETIQDWWTPVDRTEPNPFRPQINGRARLVFVAPDGEYEMAYSERQMQWFVTTSTTPRGFQQARKEIGGYHYAESELGKAVKAMRPVKEMDNIVDPLRGYAVNWNRKPKAPSRVEARELALPESIRNVERILATGDIAQAERAMVARQVEFAKMDERERGSRQNASRYRPSVPKMPKRIR